MNYEVIYIGNYSKVAEFLYFQENVKIKHILCESDKMNDDLTTFALVRNIPIHTVNSGKETALFLDEHKEHFDFSLMCSFGHYIPTDTIPEIKIFNIHYSAPPLYMGRHPTFWATINNEKNIGVSLHIATNKIDAGDIIAFETTQYYIWMNENDLFESLTEKIPCLLDKLINFLDTNGTVIANKGGNYYPPVSPINYTIDLQKDTCEHIFNIVRAQVKYKGAKIQTNKFIFWIKDVKFSFFTINEDFMIKEEILYMKIDEKICLKSSNFSIEKVDE